MDPLSYFTASAIWTGITTVVGTLSGEISGGRADEGLVLSYQKIRANLDQYRPDSNHDLERAVYRAYLQACLQTMIYRYGLLGYDAAGWVRLEALPNWTANAVRCLRTQPYLGQSSETERQWIEAAMTSLRDALAFSGQPEFVRKLSVQPELAAMREKYVLLLRSPAGEAQLTDLRDPLIESVLADLEQLNHGLPEGLAVVIRKHWFDLFCGCFQSLFKSDDKVQAIVQGKLLAGLSIRQADGSLASFDVETISQKLLAGIEPALRTVLDEFATRIENRIDVRADRLEALLNTLSQQLSAHEINTRNEQLSAAGLLSPPPQTAPTYAGNLPQQKLFVGRRDWLNIIEQRLRTDETINITSLHGVPGVGKSALALACAYRFAELFPAGSYWLDLRGNDPASALRVMLLDSGLAQVSELEGGFAEACAVWRNRSHGMKLLLIIDNAEKLVSSQPELLPRLCPSAPARTLITSRVVIDPNRDLRIDILSKDDALELLKERGVDLEAQREDATILVQRLGRLALALDITARRMALQTPARTCVQVLADLDRAGSVIDLLRLPRQNNVDDNVAESFALSYAMLDEPLRAAFHALGSCAPSGAPLSALATLLEVEEDEAHELALALSALSLAECDGTRVELHPLLHEYARARLHEAPEREQELIVRHAGYFGQTIGGAYQQATNEARGSEAYEALTVIAREQDNVQLAQVRALADTFPNPRLAVELTVNLTMVWRLRDDARLFDWLTRALALAEATGMKHHQANVLKAIGDVQSFRDDKDAALASYDKALTLFTQVGAKLGQTAVYVGLGKATGEAQHFEKAIALHTEIHSRYDVAVDKYYFGFSRLQSGDGERGLKLLLEARETWEQINFAPGVQAVDGLLSQLQGDRKETDER